MKPKIMLCLALVLSGNCHAAIVYPKAPDGGQQVAYEGVASFLKMAPTVLGGARIEELTTADPHQSYSANQQDVISSHLLSGAKLAAAGWRYFVMRGTNAVGVVELKADEKGGKTLKFVALYQGLATAMRTALRKAEQLPQVKKQDYEFRYLNLAPLSFFAVWLHGKSDDIVIPLPPTYERYNAYQPYSESEIIKILKPEAEKKIKEQAGMVD